eukprot:s226_g13.t1
MAPGHSADPGTGSLILHLVLGVCVALLLAEASGEASGKTLRDPKSPTLRIVRLLAATAALLVVLAMILDAAELSQSPLPSAGCRNDGSGYALDIARELLNLTNCNLLLVARRKDRLQHFAAKHSTGARAVEVVSMDLAMDGAARELHNILVAADLAEKIDVLVLNAGAALSGSFVDADLDSLTPLAARRFCDYSNTS